MYKTTDYNSTTTFWPLLFVLLPIVTIGAQNQQGPQAPKEITLKQSQDWALKNYPLIAKLELIDKSTEYKLKNTINANLPKVSVNGQVSYQSEVTAIPIDLPNLEVPVIANDQYKIFADIYQPLTGFSLTSAQREGQALEGDIKKQQVLVDLYQLRDRINQLYFGLLLLKVKDDQFELHRADIDSTLHIIEVSISQGLSTPIDRNILMVERLKVIQQIDANRAQEKSFLSMLSALIGIPVTSSTELRVPKAIKSVHKISRPEIRLFELTRQVLDLKQDQISLRNRPNLGLFIQSGFGRPALNFLSNDFAPYYIAGIRFGWDLGKMYNSKNDRENLTVQKQISTAQQETFVLNTELTSTNQIAEIDKLEQLIVSDSQLVRLQDDIKTTAEVQLQNGLITTLDYIKIINESSRARQQMELHRLMLLHAQFNLSNTLGN